MEETDVNNLAGIAANMATTSTELLLGKMIPERLRRDDDIEIFIKDC